MGQKISEAEWKKLERKWDKADKKEQAYYRKMAKDEGFLGKFLRGGIPKEQYYKPLVSPPDFVSRLKPQSKPKPKPKPKPSKTLTLSLLKKKPKRKPKSRRNNPEMYPPPKTKKSLRPTLSQINSYFDKKKAGKKKNAANASVKKRLEFEKKLADSSAKISSRRVQSPSLKAELAKKEKAKKIASQRKNLKAQQQKRKYKQKKNIISIINDISKGL